VIFSWPIARATIRERLNPAAGICAAMLVLLGLFRGGAAAGAEAFSGGSAAWVAILVIVLGGGLISSEVESGHAQLVLLKPITRAQWVCGRFLGAAIVFAAGAFLAWAGSMIAAVVRGGDLLLSVRLSVLPLVLLQALAWLATAVALSTVLRGWINVVVAVAVKTSWLFASNTLPVFYPKLLAIVPAVDPYTGPQDALSPFLLGQQWLPVAAWNLFWMFAALTLAAWLFNRRELARRRA
jgi:ABC-type transport system involved in multi-copper enzyme maturation permease subunit